MKPVFVRRFFSLVAVPFLLSGCSDPTGPQAAPRGLEIRPTAAVFPITTVEGKRRVTMQAVVDNDSERTVYYSYCSETVWKRVGSEWEHVWSPVCASILVPPEPIAPGESKQLTLDFIEHPEISSIGFPFQDPGAEYRLEVTLLVRSGEKFRLLKGTDTGTFAVRN